jgi:hypothetical protein
VVELGMTADEFWELCPRQFNPFVKRWEGKREHEEFMLSQLTAVTANFSMRGPKEPYSSTHFMLSKREQQPKKPRLNRKGIASQVRGALAAMAVLSNG